MTNCCLDATDRYFDDEHASNDLKKYHKKGPQGTTRILVDALKKNDLTRFDMLEVGGGIGIIFHELIPTGIEKVFCVEMSLGAMRIAREEAKRRGYDDRYFSIHGDFLDKYTTVPECDIVTLDRVVCCYPDAEGLTAAAITKCRDLLAISYPREKWYIRMGFEIENWQRRRSGKEFRTYIHAEDMIREQIKQAGFVGIFSEKTFVWNVEIYRRADAA